MICKCSYICFFTGIFLTICFFTNAQEVKLMVSKGSMFNKSGKFIKITFCSKEGLLPALPEKFLQYSDIYFLYSPEENENWTFSSKDIDKYKDNISVKQNDNIIKSNGVQLISPKILVASFPKSQIKIIKPFNFINETGISESISLRENFWPNYNSYYTYYSNGKNNLNTGEYLKAFENLQNFLNTTEEISSFSFYTSSRELINKTINEYLDNIENSYNGICSATSKTVNESQLESLDKIKKSLTTAKNSFEIYFEKYDINGTDTIDDGYKNRIEKLSNNIDSKSEQLNELFKKQVMDILIKGKYETSQFRLYINLITKLYFYNDSISIKSGIDTININNLYKFKEDYEKLKQMQGWLKDFVLIVKYINYDIELKKYIFNDEVISNLQSQVNKQTQPYYEIFTAINYLGKKDKDNFYKQLGKVYQGCTDEKLLDDIESYFLYFYISDARENIISILNEGQRYLDVKLFEKARDRFNEAYDYNSNNPLTLYYLGKTYVELEQPDAAQKFFTRAEKEYTQFIMTRKCNLNIYINNQEYDKALVYVSLAIENNPIWYYYYMKATILEKQSKLMEAKKVILDNCIGLNPYSIDEYFLLGDICMNLKDFKGAEEYYNKVGDIDPTNKSFSDRLKTLRATKSEAANP